MKPLFIRQPRGCAVKVACLLLMTVCLCLSGICMTAAEDAALWGGVPITETQPTETTAKPQNSTSVGNLNLPDRETAPAVS